MPPRMMKGRFKRDDQDENPNEESELIENENQNNRINESSADEKPQESKSQDNKNDENESNKKGSSFLSKLGKLRGKPKDKDDVDINDQADKKPSRSLFGKDKSSKKQQKEEDSSGKTIGKLGPGENETDDVEAGNLKKDLHNSLFLGPMKVLEPIRTDVVKAFNARQKKLERINALNIPEIHYIGQIVSGRKIAFDSTDGVLCRWKIDHGKCWEFLGGHLSGQTHVGYCKFGDHENVVFNHPIDVHFAEAGVPGWGSPHISFQSFRLDWHGRRILAGYGFCHLPNTPGFHKIEIPLWRPSGTVEEELHGFFLGRTPALASQEPIFESAWRDRCRLVTVSAGSIVIELFVTTRNTQPHNIDNIASKN